MPKSTKNADGAVKGQIVFSECHGPAAGCEQGGAFPVFNQGLLYAAALDQVIG